MDRIKLFKLQRGPGEKTMVEVPSAHVPDYLKRGYQVGHPREIREVPGYSRALILSIEKEALSFPEFVDRHCLFDRFVGLALKYYARDPAAVEDRFEMNLYEQRDRLLGAYKNSDDKRSLELNIYWQSCLEIGQENRQAKTVAVVPPFVSAPQECSAC